MIQYFKTANIDIAFILFLFLITFDAVSIFHFADTTMDLSKVRKADYQFDMLITSHQARRIRDRETIVATNFTDTKSMVEIYPLAFNRTINWKEE